MCLAMRTSARGISPVRVRFLVPRSTTGTARLRRGVGIGGPTLEGGLPIIKPPYGQIAAINLDKGEITWKVPHGETPENVKNHPALKGLNIPRTGKSGSVGTMV